MVYKGIGNGKIGEKMGVKINSNKKVHVVITGWCVINPQGKLEDRKPLMLLFDDVAIHYILSAAQ